MKTGEASEPLRAPNGFHILKLVEIRNAEKSGVHNYSKNEARALIFQQKFNEKVHLWLQKMRETAYIKIM
jgi:peptidyl-prolyl cis-trans isomerase SurA